MADVSLDELWEEITASLQHMVLTFSGGVVEAISLLFFHIPVFILHLLRLMINLILVTFIGVSNVVHSFCYDEIPYLFNEIITSEYIITFMKTLSRISSSTLTFVVWTFHQIILLAKPLLDEIGTYIGMFYFTSMDMLKSTSNYLVSSITSVLCMLTEKVLLVCHLLLGFVYGIVEVSWIYVHYILKSLRGFLSATVNELYSLCKYVSLVFEETDKHMHVQSGSGGSSLEALALFVIYLLTVVAVVTLSLRLIGRGEYDRRHFENQERP